MDSKTIYFVDENQEYLKAIERCLVNNCKEWDVTLINNIRRLHEILLSNKNKVNLLLISEKMYIDDLKELDIHKIAILSEDEINTRGKTVGMEKPLVVYKYQTCEKLQAEIIALLTEESVKREFNEIENNTKIIAVYSPIGGVGKTTIAVMLSILAAYQEKRVMYLNLENVPSTRNYFESQNGENLSKIIYYLSKKKDIVQDKIAKVQQLDLKHNVYFFAPADNVDDLSTMSISEYSILLESICKVGKYDYLFIDFSSESGSKMKEMLNLCDKILLVVSSGGSSVEKIRIYENEIVNSQVASSLMEKTSIIFNKYLHEYNSNADKIIICDKKVEYRLPYEDSLNFHSEDGFFIDVNSPMQKQVIEMLRNI
ncbi:MAG: hypothetical protein COA82_12010 [Alkaliphilus sp.]|nr:AAA family ATPase [bacterium AH-315-K05]PHS29956.1 MAG: hypothetical protein COA82_12010 [Alkaliphilus sp.]